MIANTRSGTIMQHMQLMFSVGTYVEMSDAELRVRFTERGEYTESAFTLPAKAAPLPVMEIVARTATGRTPATTKGVSRRSLVLPSRAAARIARFVLLAVAVSCCGAAPIVLPQGNALDSGADPPASGLRSGPAAPNPPRPETSAKVDRLGDPLPAGAISRLGTQRFQDGQPVLEVAYSPDGHVVTSGRVGDNEVVRIWDAASGRALHRLNVEGIGIQNLVFSGNGKMLAHTFSDWEKRRILIWDVATGRRSRRIDSPTGNFEALAFSPDGKLLAALHDPDDRPGQDDIWSIQIYDSATFEVR
jgi:WD domain, G-beta repeat